MATESGQLYRYIRLRLYLYCDLFIEMRPEPNQHICLYHLQSSNVCSRVVYWGYHVALSIPYQLATFSVVAAKAVFTVISFLISRFLPCTYIANWQLKSIEL